MKQVLCIIASASLVCCATQEPEAERSTAAPIKQNAGEHVSFESTAQRSATRFALFVGINDYPNLPRSQQLKGALNDVAAMKRVFVDGAGFNTYSVLTNRHATRTAIGSAFAELIKRVTAAANASDHARCTALIFYAGHGGRVKDQNGDERDGIDETWVPSDALHQSGALDIRDDDIGELVRRLVNTGSQVVLISDSCFSGSIERANQNGRTRLCRWDLARPVAGPTDSTLDLKSSDLKQVAIGEDEVPSIPGVIVFGAAQPHQKAGETRIGGNAFGRLTFVLRRVLPWAIGARVATQDVFRRVEVEFQKLWPTGSQSPWLVASAGKRSQRFLVGGFDAQHGRIVPNSRDRNRFDLDIGSLFGVRLGARFDMFSSVERMRQDKSIGQAKAVEVGPLRTTVEFGPLSGALSEGAIARLDRVEFGDFAITLGKGLSRPITKAVVGTCKRLGVRVVGAEEEHDIIVQSTASGGIAILGSSGKEIGGGLRLSSNSAEDIAKVFERECLHLARAKRLISLSHNGDWISTRVVHAKRATVIKSRSARLRTDELLLGGERFNLRVHNKSAHALYFTMILIRDDGRMRILYPALDEIASPISAGRKELVGDDNPFSAIADPDGQSTRRWCIKILATLEDLDFFSLMVEPNTQRDGACFRPPAVRQDGHRLHRLMADILHGGPRLERSRQRVRGVVWAASELVVHVAQRR